MVEVLSPGSVSRDWREKMDVYAEHGVREYWIVDPDARRAWVMTRIGSLAASMKPEIMELAMTF